jgi:putative MATE family efflux protein
MANGVTHRESFAAFWAAIREALGGSHQDYTTGSISRAIFLLAVPMVLEMAMESLFSIVDVFWVARLGENAVATVGLTESIMALLYGGAAGLSISATAMVARRVGEKDPEGAAVACVQAIALGIGLGIIGGIPGLFLSHRLLRLMGGSPQLIAVGSGYTRIALGACLIPVLLFMNNAIFRGAGDPALAMRVLWLSNIINLLLDPCLIFGLGPFPRLGVAGAAVATLTGRGTGLVYQFYLLLKGGRHIQVEARHVHLDVPVMGRMLKVSLAGAVQLLIPQTAWTGLMRIVSVFGAASLASYTIAMRIMVFFIMPSWGLSGAAATLVGQNLGAGRPERAEQSVWETGFYNVLFLGGVGGFFLLFPGPVIRLFTHDPAVIPQGIDCLRILSYGNIGYAYGIVMLQAFNGAGDTRTPTLVNLLGFWLIEIPLAYGLAISLGWRSHGVYWAIVMTDCAIAAASILMFRRGRWKKQEI